MKTRNRGKTRGLIVLALLISLLSLTFLMIRHVYATLEYTIDKEFVYVEINRNGTVYLFYNLNISITGDPQKGIPLRLPNINATNIAAIDGNGNPLKTTLEKDPYPMIEILWSKEDEKGITNTTITVNASTFIYTNMFYNDTKTNPGNVAMKFQPAWFDDVKTNGSLEIKVVLPEGVNSTNLKSTPLGNMIVDGIEAEYLGQLYSTNFSEPRSEAIWRIEDWPSKNVFECYVSFPANYMELNMPLPPEGKGFDWAIILIPISFVSGPTVTYLIYLILSRSRRQRRRTRRTERERQTTQSRQRRTEREVEARPTPRIKENLTMAEAAVAVNKNISCVVSLIIFTMIRKKALEVLVFEPELKVRRTTPTESLENYEQEFYDTINSDGSFDMNKLKEFYNRFKRNVDSKMRSYDTESTADFYRGCVEDCLKLVESADVFLEVREA
jgi:hypothetical protein